MVTTEPDLREPLFSRRNHMSIFRSKLEVPSLGVVDVCKFVGCLSVQPGAPGLAADAATLYEVSKDGRSVVSVVSMEDDWAVIMHVGDHYGKSSGLSSFRTDASACRCGWLRSV
jgi:hypothetical protein